MTRFSGFVGNTPVDISSGYGNYGDGRVPGVTSASVARGASKEKRLADLLAKGLDTLSINYIHVVHCFLASGVSLNMNMFDLIMAFITRYALMYREGEIDDRSRLYRACEISHYMLAAVEASDQPSPRRSRLP